MEKSDKGAFMQISQVFGTLYMLTIEWCFETALFRESSDRVFDSLYFQENVSYDDFLFCENV